MRAQQRCCCNGTCHFAKVWNRDAVWTEEVPLQAAQDVGNCSGCTGPMHTVDTARTSLNHKRQHLQHPRFLRGGAGARTTGL